MDKRDFLKAGGLLGLGAVIAPAAMAKNIQRAESYGIEGMFDTQKDEYTLPALPYAYDALEPNIDKQTMTLHHDKHHNGYVKGLNNATKKIKEATDAEDFGLIKHWERELAFHGAGHFLHSLFWTVMGPKQGEQSKTLKKYIKKSFGSEDAFKKQFYWASKKVEGSGWGILAYEPMADKLVILQAEKHANQSQWLSVPILVVDVWEHAYYLKYQNKRGDYINGFMNVVNWEAVSERLEKLVAGLK